MILLIDNYDSFTYNLYHYLIQCGAEVLVKRNDAISIDDIKTLSPHGIVISPGPCTPNEAGICLDVIQEFHQHTPIFGVCLGFQSISQAFGGRICRGKSPMHAKISDITHSGSHVFEGIPSPFKATRYHSLILDDSTVPNCLEVLGHSEDGVIQALRHKDYPVFGTLFHPESIASEHGHDLLRNFLALCKTGVSHV